jgi:hypothetical protein
VKIGTFGTRCGRVDVTARFIEVVTAGTSGGKTEVERET